MKPFIVIKDKLNIRNRPSAESDDTFIGTAVKGDILFLQEETVLGTIPLGGTSKLWHTDNLNRFVAKEGVRPMTYDDKKKEFVADKSMSKYHNDTEDESQWKVSWAHVDLDIWKIWRDFETTGEGIKVAVLDTGIISHPDFERNGNSIVKGNFKLPTLINLIDENGHGTQCAGILSAVGSQIAYGIAPGVDLYVVKITTGGGISSNGAQILGGLQILMQNQPEIDVISISLSHNTDNPTLADVLKQLAEKTIILSALNHHITANNFVINDSQFPANYDGVIPVAAYDKDASPSILPVQLLSKKNPWAYPGNNILTLGSDGNIAAGVNTSIATPIGAGIFALFLSYMKKKGIPVNTVTIGKLKDLLTELEQIPLTISGQPSSTQVNMKNPYNAFQQFNNAFNV